MPDLLSWTRFAIDTEERGILFYRKCLANTTNKQAVDLFAYLLKVEKGHKAMLTTLLNASAKGDYALIKASIADFLELNHPNPMFPKEALHGMLKPDTALKEMIDNAIRLEDEGIELYTKLEAEQEQTGKADKDDSIRALFKKLINDETTHKEEIKDLGRWVFGIDEENKE